MFTAALFTIAKTWGQCKCSLTDEWRKKVRYTNTMECYSTIKMNEIKPFAATSMGLEIVTPSEVRQGKSNVIQKPDFTVLYIDFGTTVKIKD